MGRPILRAKAARYASAVGAIAGVLLLLSSSSYAQDATQDQAMKDENEVLDLLNKNPASALDVALLGLRQREIVAFIGSKPAIFKRDSFNYLEATYDDHVIAVGLSYRSESSDIETLVADCTDSLDIAVSALMRNVPTAVGSVVGSDDKKSLECKADEYFMNNTITRVQQIQITSPGWNICDSMRVYVSVSHEPHRAICRKDHLRDKDVVVLRN